MDVGTIPNSLIWNICKTLAITFQNKSVQLLPGYKILVHGGTGALGQAAIAIALNNGCEVFTTVSDTQKKSFLMKLFPELQGFLMSTMYIIYIRALHIKLAF